jgi:hypothetical protein
LSISLCPPLLCLSVLVLAKPDSAFGFSGFGIGARALYFLRQHFLYFFPLPQGHGSLRPIYSRAESPPQANSMSAEPPASSSSPHCSSGVCVTDYSRSTYLSGPSSASTAHNSPKRRVDPIVTIATAFVNRATPSDGCLYGLARDDVTVKSNSRAPLHPRTFLKMGPQSKMVLAEESAIWPEHEH